MCHGFVLEHPTRRTLECTKNKIVYVSVCKFGVFSSMLILPSIRIPAMLNCGFQNLQKSAPKFILINIDFVISFCPHFLWLCGLLWNHFGFPMVARTIVTAQDAPRCHQEATDYQTSRHHLKTILTGHPNSQKANIYVIAVDSGRLKKDK